MRNGRTMVTITMLAASLMVTNAAGAEQRWQCGDGLSVPLQGTRQDRDEACRKLRDSTNRPASSGLSPEREQALRERIEALERQHGLEIDVETR